MLDELCLRMQILLVKAKPFWHCGSQSQEL